MSEIKRIVVPVDNSETSRIAAQHAAKLAKSMNIDVIVLSIDTSQGFVISPFLEGKLKKENEAILKEYQKLIESHDVFVHTEMIRGLNAADEIIKFANADDLIIMVSHNKKGLDRFVMGSVSEKVIWSATCPVMIIKP